MAQVTVYFDGHFGLTDSSGGWTNDANAADGSTATYADCDSNLSGNYLEIAGTSLSTDEPTLWANAESTFVTKVEMRVYATVGDVRLTIYNNLTGAYSTGDIAPGGWSDWADIGEPPSGSGGWSILIANAIRVRAYCLDDTARLHAVELRITYQSFNVNGPNPYRVKRTDSGGAVVSSLDAAFPWHASEIPSTDDLLVVIAGNDADNDNGAALSTTSTGWIKLSESGDGTSDSHVAIFYAHYGGTTDTQPTIDGAESDEMALYYIWVKNGKDSTPVYSDINTPGTGVTSNPYFHNNSTSVLTDVSQYELVLAAIATDGSDVTADQTSFTGTGWYQVESISPENSGNDVGLALAVTHITADNTAPATCYFSSSTTDGWANVCVAFQLGEFRYVTGTTETLSVTEQNATVNRGFELACTTETTSIDVSPSYSYLIHRTDGDVVNNPDSRWANAANVNDGLLTTFASGQAGDPDTPYGGLYPEPYDTRPSEVDIADLELRSYTYSSSAGNELIVTFGEDQVTWTNLPVGSENVEWTAWRRFSSGPSGSGWVWSDFEQPGAHYPAHFAENDTVYIAAIEMRFAYGSGDAVNRTRNVNCSTETLTLTDTDATVSATTERNVICTTEILSLVENNAERKVIATPETVLLTDTDATVVKVKTVSCSTEILSFTDTDSNVNRQRGVDTWLRYEALEIDSSLFVDEVVLTDGDGITISHGAYYFSGDECHDGDPDTYDDHAFLANYHVFDQNDWWVVCSTLDSTPIAWARARIRYSLNASDGQYELVWREGPTWLKDTDDGVAMPVSLDPTWTNWTTIDPDVDTSQATRFNTRSDWNSGSLSIDIIGRSGENPSSQPSYFRVYEIDVEVAIEQTTTYNVKVKKDRGVTTTTETALLTEQNALINSTDRDVTCTTEILDAVENTATVNAERAVTTTTEVALLTDTDATVSIERTVSCSTEILDAVENTVTVNAERAVTTATEVALLTVVPTVVTENETPQLFYDALSRFTDDSNAVDDDPDTYAYNTSGGLSTPNYMHSPDAWDTDTRALGVDYFGVQVRMRYELISGTGYYRATNSGGSPYSDEYSLSNTSGGPEWSEWISLNQASGFWDTVDEIESWVVIRSYTLGTHPVNASDFRIYQGEYRIILTDGLFAVNATRNVNCTTEALAFTDTDATVNAERGVTTTTEIALLTDTNATVDTSQPRNVICTTEILSLTDTDTTVNRTRDITTTTEATLLTDTDATVNRTRDITTTTEVTVLTDTDATVNRKRNVTTAIEIILFTDTDATIDTSEYEEASYISTGTANVVGLAEYVAEAQAAATGQSIAATDAAAIAETQGQISGSSTVEAISAGIFESDAVATGSAITNVNAVAIWPTDTSSIGQATTSADSGAIWTVDFTSVGTATVAGITENVFEAAGTSTGTSTVSGITENVYPSEYSESGTSTVLGYSAYVIEAEATASSSASVAGFSEAIYESEFAESGTSTATAYADSISTSEYTSLGTSIVAGTSEAIHESAYSVPGAATVLGYSENIYESSYTSTGLADVVGVSPAVYDLEGFRFRSDDGTEITASWIAAQDIGISQDKGAVVRLRVLVNVSGDPDSDALTLQYREVGGGDNDWRKV